MAEDATKRQGLRTYRRSEAPLLHETQMMSMPTLDPPATEQLVEWATNGGQVVKVLVGDPEAGGPSLVWSWFGPGFTLPRHSHSADCLYYVARGEVHLGNLVLGEGDGFVVPADAPYAYTAGPDGVEVLEFRTSAPFDMRITESLARWEQIVAGSRQHKEQWAEGAPN